MPRWRRLWQAVYRVLTRPLFNTITIPRDARVDPSQFSPDEYPVWCPDCGYLLRGLTEDRCPECGKAFDRGRLLVQQYIRLQLPKRHRVKRWTRPLLWCGWGVFVLSELGMMTLLAFIRDDGRGSGLATRLFNHPHLFFVWLVGGKLLPCALVMAGSVAELSATWPLRKKRKAVLLVARADVLRARAAASATSK